MKELRVGTIFSGIGAPEQGLKRLGVPHKIIFACDNGEREADIDYEKEFEAVKNLGSVKEKREYVENLYKEKCNRKNFVQQSYLANYEVEDGNFFQDVKLLDGRDFTGKIDLFIGGSPCQSFSVGSHERLGFNDTRGTLFFEFCRLVNEIQPKVFIYENVFAVLNHDNGKTWETMLNAFEDIGYKFTWKILDAKKYGIPQNRRRLFVIGFKDEKALEDFKFPEEVELKYTMQDFLEDNVEIGGISNVNGKLTITSDKKGEPDEKYFLSDKMTKYVLTPGSKGFTRKLETDRKIAATIVKKAYNCYRAGITNYVTKNGRLRNLTVREIHRLMGFPDDYNIVVSKSQAGRQAGNSIVVDVIMALEREIIKAQKWDTE